MTSEFKKFRDIVKKKRRFVLTTHINPDGDGIGSELALASFLRRKRKQVSILNHSQTPPNYRFLDPKGIIEQYNSGKHASLLADAEVIIVLDTNHPDRLVSLKDEYLRSKAYKVCIDHHLEPADFADLYIIDEPSTATGEILYRLLLSLDKKAISKDISIFLYTAIMTDTGSFRYPKTDEEVHKVIAHLIQQGADPVSIYDKVYEQGSAGRLKLLGRALADMKVVHNGRVAYLIITKEMLAETGTREPDTDAFVPYTLSIEGIEIGMMFTELNDGVKINFRSRGEIQINELAKEFGGNGHMNAAGARVHHQPLSEVVQKVVERSKTYAP